ncbi:MAG: hypothetical protein WCS37_07020 [Chloroflexota bacterium]
MADVKNIKDDFLNSLNACRQLYRHCLSPKALHSEAGVEAAFLQMQTAWEVFLEEIFLLYICGEQPLSGNQVSPYFTVNDIEVARKILYQERPYCEWSKPEIIRERFNEIYFVSPNRLDDAIRPIVGTLSEIATIRNYIAHSSLKAKKAFGKVWLQKVGGKPNITRAADFLLLIDKDNPPDTYFDKYITNLEVTANNIAG